MIVIVRAQITVPVIVPDAKSADCQRTIKDAIRAFETGLDHCAVIKYEGFDLTPTTLKELEKP